MEQQPYFIKFDITDKTTLIIKGTEYLNDGKVIRDTMKLEMSVARVFHRALNRGRLTNIFEKNDYELLGSMLYKILTDDDNVRSFILPEIKDTIYNKDRRCRISLQFSGVPELASLPWEYIQIPKNNPDGLPPLFLSANVTHQFDVCRSVAIDKNLKHAYINAEAQKQLTVILALINETGEKALNQVELFRDEMKKIQKKYEYTDEAGNKKQKLEFWEITNPTPSDFLTQLSNLSKNITGPYVFHFYGHAQMTDDGPQIGLTNNNGKLTWIQSDDFADYFSVPAKEQPELIVLQACESGQVDMQGNGIGIHLAQKGIPAVLSMQNIITEETAIKFMVQFYDSILSGHHVGEAVTMGRTFLGCQDKPPAKHCADNTFGTPVLYITTDEPIQLMPREPDREKKIKKMQCKSCTRIWKDPLKNICPEMGCRGELVPYKDKEEAVPLKTEMERAVSESAFSGIATQERKAGSFETAFNNTDGNNAAAAAHFGKM